MARMKSAGRLGAYKSRKGHQLCQRVNFLKARSGVGRTHRSASGKRRSWGYRHASSFSSRRAPPGRSRPEVWRGSGWVRRVRAKNEIRSRAIPNRSDRRPATSLEDLDQARGWGSRRDHSRLKAIKLPAGPSSRPLDGLPIGRPPSRRFLARSCTARASCRDCCGVFR